MKEENPFLAKPKTADQLLYLLYQLSKQLEREAESDEIKAREMQYHSGGANESIVLYDRAATKRKIKRSIDKIRQSNAS